MSAFWSGRLVRLRGIETDDWSAFMRFDGHADDQRSTDMIHPPRSAAAYQAWAAERAVAPATNDSFQLAIETIDRGELAGSLSTHGVDARAGRFGYGIGIGAPYQRRGYATEAVLLLLRFMFGERRYHKCETRVYAYNVASLELHRSLGFVEEGRLRDHEFFAGRHHDVVVMGMTGVEFGERYPYERL